MVADACGASGAKTCLLVQPECASGGPRCRTTGALLPCSATSAAWLSVVTFASTVRHRASTSRPTTCRVQSRPCCRFRVELQAAAAPMHEPDSFVQADCDLQRSAFAVFQGPWRRFDPAKLCITLRAARKSRRTASWRTSRFYSGSGLTEFGSWKRAFVMTLAELGEHLIRRIRRLACPVHSAERAASDVIIQDFIRAGAAANRLSLAVVVPSPLVWVPMT